MAKSRYDRTPKKVYFYVNINWITELDSLDKIIEELEKLKQQEGVFTDIFVDIHSYNSDFDIEAHFQREETQEEADRRVDALIEKDKAEAEENRKKKKELEEKAAARAEIDRLRNKYNI